MSRADMIQTLMLEIAQTRDTIQALRVPCPKSLCRRSCTGSLETVSTNQEDAEDLRLLLIQFPEDLRVLTSDPALMHAFERHYKGVVKKRDLPLLLRLYELPCAVVLLPEISWQKSLSLLALKDDRTLDKLRKSWARSVVSDEIKRERIQIISRMTTVLDPTRVPL